MIASIPSSFFLPPENLEGVVAAGDLVDLGVFERWQQLRDIRRRAESVAAALYEQHRLDDRRQVRVAPFVQLSRRMQRIAEEHQALDAIDALGRDVRRHPPAHGLSADEEGKRIEGRVTRRERVAPRLLEHRRPIGHLPARGDVGEIEGRGADVALRHAAREADHERVLLAGAGAMRKHEGCFGAGGGVGLEGHGLDGTARQGRISRLAARGSLLGLGQPAASVTTIPEQLTANRQQPTASREPRAPSPEPRAPT